MTLLTAFCAGLIVATFGWGWLLNASMEAREKQAASDVAYYRELWFKEMLYSGALLRAQMEQEDAEEEPS